MEQRHKENMEFIFGNGGVIQGFKDGRLYFERIVPPVGRIGTFTQEEYINEIQDKIKYRWVVEDMQHLNDILEIASGYEPFVLELDNGVIINCNNYVKESFDFLIGYVKYALEIF